MKVYYEVSNSGEEAVRYDRWHEANAHPRNGRPQNLTAYEDPENGTQPFAFIELARYTGPDQEDWFNTGSI